MINRRDATKLLGAGLCLPFTNALWANNQPVSQLIEAVKTITQGDKIELKLLYPEGSLANIKILAELFKRQTGVTISLQETGVDRLSSDLILDHSSAKHTVDIALPATFSLPTLIDADALLCLDQFEAKYQDLSKLATSLYTIGDYHQGKRYGFQTDGDSYLLFLNSKMIKSAKLNSQYEDTFGNKLTLAQSWSQLDSQMKFFNQPQQQLFGGALFRTPNYMLWEWWVRLHSNGSFPVTDDFEPLINSPQGVSALQAMLDATQSQHPSVIRNSLFDNWELYAKGNCFCNIGWGGTQKYLRRPQSAIKDQVQTNLLPGFQLDGLYQPLSYFNWGWNYVVLANSQHPELAYLFALFATQPDQSALAIAQPDGYFDPFQKSHYENSQIKSIYGDEFLQAHQQSMTSPIPDFYVQANTAYFDSLRKAIMSAQSGAISAQKALDLAAIQWQVTTLEVGKQQQQKQWRSLKSLYPENLKRYIQNS